MKDRKLFPQSSLTSSMREVLLKELVGQTFLYRSKYGGETFGEIKDVLVSLSYTHDKETSAAFKEILDYKSKRNQLIRKKEGKAEIDKPKWPRLANPFSAFRPEIHIKSTSNISYDLNDIFILSKKKKDV